MNSLDDTQPNIPLQGPPDYVDDDEGSSSPGCLVWGSIAGFALLLALLIVILAGAAGWTEGQNEGDRMAAAAESDLRGVQLTRIPAELEAGNAELVEIRLNYLETVVPNEAALPQIRATLTSMAIINATATLSAAVDPVIAGIVADVANNDLVSLRYRLAYLEQVIPGTVVVSELRETVEALEAAQGETVDVIETPEATLEPVIAADDGGFDIDGMFTQAQTLFAQGRYKDAYDLLDAITRIDQNARRAEVEGLLREVLTAWAGNLYLRPDESNLAEAIRVTNLLEDAGGALGDLAYERFIAGLYLDARRAIDLGSHSLAIQRLNEIRAYQAEYKGVNLNRLLFDQYVKVGDAQFSAGNFCLAVIELNRAQTVIADSAIRSRAESAQQLCDASMTQTAIAPLFQETATPPSG